MSESIGRYNILLEMTSNSEEVKKDITSLNGIIKKSGKNFKELVSNQEAVANSQKEVTKTSKEYRKEFKEQISNVRIFGFSLGGTISQLKNFVGALGTLRRGLGATSRLNADQIKGVARLTSLFGGGRTAILGFAKGLQIFKAALISTGIGALIVALGSVITFLSKTQKGMDLLERASASVGTVFNVIIDRVTDLGELITNTLLDENGEFSLTSAFTNLGQSILDNVINRFKSALVFGDAVAELLKGNFSIAAEKAKTGLIQLGTGLDAIQQSKAGEVLSGIGKEISEEVKVTDNLIIRLQKLREERIKLDVATARSRAEQKELNRIVEDTTKTFTDRIAAAQRVEELESRLLNRRIALQQEEVDIIRIQNDLSKSTLEDRRRLADAQVVLANLVEESQERQTTNQNKLNILITQQRAAVQKLADEYRKLGQDIEIALSDDPLKKLTLEAARQFDAIEKSRKDKIDGLSILGLSPEDEANEIARINEIAEGQIKVLQKSLKAEILALNNEVKKILPQNSLIEQFINGDRSVAIEDIFPDQQFGALVARVRKIQEELASIGDIDNVNEFNLSKALEQELKSIIELLGDSPEAKEVNRLVNQIGKVDEVENRGGFLQRLLGLDDEGFEEFKNQANNALEATKQFVNNILEQQQKRLDGEIEAQQENVEAATKLAEKGNAEILQAEEERLAELTRQREESAQRQRELAQIEAAANTLIGLTNAIAQPFPLNLAAFPLVLALIGQLSGGLGGIPGFIEGTELVGADPRFKSNKKKQGQDGYLLWADGQERIVPPAINKALQGIPNSRLPEAVKALKVLSNKPIINDSKMEVVRGESSSDNSGIETRIDKMTDKIEKLNGNMENMRLRVSLDAKGFNASQQVATDRQIRRKRSVS